MDISQASVDSVISQGQSFVIDSELVEDRRVDVVDRSRAGTILRAESPLVAFAIGSPFYPAPAEPVREYKRIVITSLATLRAGHATKLGRPEDEGVVQHPSLFEVFDQSGGSTSHTEREGSVVSLNVFMTVPIPAGKTIVIAAPDLDKANSALEESARHEAFPSEKFRLCLFIEDSVIDAWTLRGETVQCLDVSRFCIERESIGGAELHRGSEFVGADAGAQSVVSRMRVRVEAIHPREDLETGPVIFRVDELAGRRVEIRHRSFAAGANHGTLVLSREEGIGPILRSV